MRALITGGAGFIGFHLARHLAERGDEVCIVDSHARGSHDVAYAELISQPGVQALDADLLNATAFDGLDRDFTHVYHMAAIIGVENVLERPYAVLRDNVKMLEAVLDFAGTLRCLERVIFPSTSEVYAGTLKHFSLPIPTPESTPLAVTDLAHARTSYMLSKIYGEALCHQSGLPFTILRPHNVYGPRMGLQHVIPELLQRAHHASDGSALEVYSIEHTRTFCYVDDAVELIRRLAETEDGAGGTFNIGAQDREITIGELARLIIALVGKSLEVLPASVTPGSPSRRCPDMTHTISVAGYTPSIGLEEGVRRTLHWYQSHVFGGATA